jgi:nitrite reductase (NADH) small subunit
VGRLVSRHRVCSVDELPPGSRKIVNVDGRSIGVFNSSGEYYAVRNTCPHQGAELCLGRVGGTLLPAGPHEYVYGLAGRILRCPWHGFEFDLATGRSLFDPEGFRVKTYPVTVEEGAVMLETSDARKG